MQRAVIRSIAILSLAVSALTAQSCSKPPEWKALNDSIIARNSITVRPDPGIAKTGIAPSLADGTVAAASDIPAVERAPGVKSIMAWGSSVMHARTTLEPGAVLAGEKLDAGRFIMLTKGSANLTGGVTREMKAVEYRRMTPISGHRERWDIIYIERGTDTDLKAGPEGAEIIEVMSPPPLSLLKLAGAPKIPSKAPATPAGQEPSLTPGTVYDFFSIQFAELYPNIDSRIITGRGVQIAFTRIDPNTDFPLHAHPEEELTVVMRGDMDITILDRTQTVTAGTAFYVPGGMVHGAAAGPKGCDVLSVFSPARPDYREAMNERLKAFHALVPEGAEIELIADGAVEGPGLVYCEGPSWVNGKLYFSSMGYDASWNGDIPNSAFVEMDPDGAYRHLVYGKMETNGTFPLPGGTLAVCDMYGHRVIEMDTKGKVLRVLASTCDGKRLDGPNDLVADTKGGVYFSDPQILPEPHYQPGRSIIYIRPGGGTVRVVPPDVLIKPNGLILSPDNSILYVNSTHENFMMAYDVQADGTLANGRKFGKLRITPEVLDQESINTQVDGMTVDERGNVYITSMKGLQIFDPDGGYIGNVRFPLMPVNCCFGGPDGRDLYILCNDKAYRLRMNVRGAAYTMH